MLKTCKHCLVEKEPNEFYKHSGTADGVRQECKACTRLYNQRYNRTDKTKAKSRRQKLKKQYGITVEIYDAMLEFQRGNCAICEKPCSTGKRLAVDHNHSTGAVRGLLCTNCNTAIGKLKDSPDLLRRAALYLEIHDADHS